MKSIEKWIIRILNIAVITLLANSYLLWQNRPQKLYLTLVVAWFILIQLVPSLYNRKRNTKKLRICANGCELLYLFLASCIITLLLHIVGFVKNSVLFLELTDWKKWLIHILVIIIVEAIVFWNGIIRIYLLSKQLGMKWRVLGILMGWIPVLNLFMLGKLLKVVTLEVDIEDKKITLNENRKAEKICKTKYPILMVHGVFFRDFRYFNYWGRIPAELRKNGAEIYYGNHQSAVSVSEAAKEIAERIREIVKETGCEKVNIIAHSKGGLDCRYALTKLEIAPYVASLTTINTPHRGCEFADYLLSKITNEQKQAVAAAYNSALKKLGDTNPDFLEAVGDLTASSCEKRNAEIIDAEGVYYQSVGSKLNVNKGGRFPLNLTNRFVESFDGNYYIW